MKMRIVLLNNDEEDGHCGEDDDYAAQVTLEAEVTDGLRADDDPQCSDHGADFGDVLVAGGGNDVDETHEKTTGSNYKCRWQMLYSISHLSLSLSTGAERRSSMAAITNADAPPSLLLHTA